MQKIELDTQGMACPMPVIKLKKLLSQLKQDALESFSIAIRFSDKGGIKDIPAFCTQAQLQCSELQEADCHYIYVLTK